MKMSKKMKANSYIKALIQIKIMKKKMIMKIMKMRKKKMIIIMRMKIYLMMNMMIFQKVKIQQL